MASDPFTNSALSEADGLDLLCRCSGLAVDHTGSSRGLAASNPSTSLMISAMDVSAILGVPGVAR